MCCLLHWSLCHRPHLIIPGKAAITAKGFTFVFLCLGQSYCSLAPWQIPQFDYWVCCLLVWLYAVGWHQQFFSLILSLIPLVSSTSGKYAPVDISVHFCIFHITDCCHLMWQLWWKLIWNYGFNYVWYLTIKYTGHWKAANWPCGWQNLQKQ